MTINKAKEGITKGDDMGKRAVMKPDRKAAQPESRPKAKTQKPDEAEHIWKGGIDHFSEGA